MSFFNYFTDAERGAAGRAAELKNRFFGWLGPVLVRLHVHPDAISYVGLACLVGLVIWFMAHPLRALLLIVLYVLIDGIDGAYARYLGRPTQAGAFTDIVCDQLGMVVVALGFIQYGLVDGVVGAYYIMIYLIMITFSVVQNAQGIPMQYILRTKYVLYGIYALWVISRVNLAPALLPVFCLVMTFSVAQSYLRLKRGFYWRYDLPAILAHEQEVRSRGGTPPRLWPALNFFLPAAVVALLLFLGAYTQIVGMIEGTDLEPSWQKSERLPLLEKAEQPRAVASFQEGILVSTYNPRNRFTRVYYFAWPSAALRGNFRLPWAIHRDHGLAVNNSRLYIADRLSRRVHDVDLPKSLARGIAVLDQSFDTTLRAPVACALVNLAGEQRMLISEYMNHYKTIMVDYEKAFAEGTAQKAVLGWYRNAGFSLGLAGEEARVLELNSSLGPDIIYDLNLTAVLGDKYLRTGIRKKIRAPCWHCAGITLRHGDLILADPQEQRLAFCAAP